MVQIFCVSVRLEVWLVSWEVESRLERLVVVAGGRGRGCRLPSGMGGGEPPRRSRAATVPLCFQ